MNRHSTRKTIFISDLAEGQQISDLYLVSRKNLGETKNGKPYLALALMDRTGEIEARIWDNAAQFDPLAEVGQVVAVEAQVKAFREQLQLTVSSLVQIEEDGYQLGDFIPASKRSIKEMKHELAGRIDEIADPHLRELLALLFQGETLKQFTKAPAAKHMHHAYIGGLLEHTLSVVGLATRLAAHYPSLDRDLLVAGALLHDLGKIREFSFNSVPFDYTEPGRLVGHLVLGSEMVRETARGIEGFPPAKLDRLIHLILSHHGKHEFGSPCLPMTAEAILLHHIDDIDAKMNFIDKLSEQVEPGSYQWSDYQRTLERFLLLRGQEIPFEASMPSEVHREQGEQKAAPGHDSSVEEKRPPNRQGKLF